LKKVSEPLRDAPDIFVGGGAPAFVSAFDSRVDRNEPVDAVDLDAVTRVEE
jgi:hypothetical protein